MPWETVDWNIWENADLEGGWDRGSGTFFPHTPSENSNFLNS